jgi:uncharacterized protein YkwD
MSQPPTKGFVMRIIGSKTVASTLFLLLCVGLSVGCGGGSGGGPGGTTANGCLTGSVTTVPMATALTGMDAAERALADECLAWVNAERAARGVAPLIWHDLAAKSAFDHSEWQYDVNGDISHTGAGGSTPTQRLTAAGVAGFSGVGENVAAGQTTAQQVMCVSWMNSPGHYGNIVNPIFTHIGIGVAIRPPLATAPYGTTWTQVFMKMP